MSPFQIIQRKKNLKMIQLKINSLGSKADEREKNMYDSLAE